MSKYFIYSNHIVNIDLKIVDNFGNGQDHPFGLDI